MDEVEVDPKLFVTCRLCLNDTGMFQIVPKVQMEIKFCFDIVVEPFDGLPQLICRTCRTTLTDFYNTKLTYIEKQNTLKAKYSTKQEVNIEVNVEATELPKIESNPPICNSPQQETVTSSQEVDDGIENNEEEGGSIIKCGKKRSILRSSSESAEDVKRKRISSPVAKRRNSKSANKISWKANYNKKVVCLLCRKHCKNKYNIVRHFKKHENVRMEYEEVFKRFCTVKLNKIDEKPNMTGSLRTVVHDSTKITSISHNGKIPYYVMYYPKENNTTTPTIGTLDSSDAESSIVKKGASKRDRLLSRSSNETVILEGANKPLTVCDDDTTKDKNMASNLDANECINIDDSSDSNDVETIGGDSDKSFKAKFTDYRKIQSIISICSNKYSKKMESSENEIPTYTESQLKHKILNMGRKVINKQGFNCTGLLRFMEHKNLDIIWTPPNHVPLLGNGNKETNYVRIMPKLKDKEKIINDNFGWKTIPETQEKGKKHGSDENSKASGKETNAVNVHLPDKSSSDTIEKSEMLNDNLSDQAVLYANSNECENSKNKLLNANPVANPKQLPKKINAIDIKSNNKIESQNSNEAVDETCVLSDHNQEKNVDLCMPIITSTTSLATPPVVEKEQDVDMDNTSSHSNVLNETEKSAPRIKVKPVSELMSERVLKNLTQQQIEHPSNIWGMNMDVDATTTSPVGNIPIRVTADATPTSSAHTLKEQINPTQPTNRDYVILHTAELPNTKTECPFKYLKELLYIHNIILLDPNETPPKNFTCLIKFKVQYKQENVVVLCITLSCSGNTFYLGVKHSTSQENIDMKLLPAYWQWEILNKIYQDEVVNKVLKNAQKISPSTHAYTKTFFCLLKSICFKKNT